METHEKLSALERVITLRKSITDLTEAIDSTIKFTPKAIETWELKAMNEALEEMPAMILSTQNKIRREVESRLEKFEKEVTEHLN